MKTEVNEFLNSIRNFITITTLFHFRTFYSMFTSFIIFQGPINTFYRFRECKNNFIAPERPKSYLYSVFQMCHQMIISNNKLLVYFKRDYPTNKQKTHFQYPERNLKS